MSNKNRVEPCTTAYMAAITCDLSVVEQESDLRRAHRKIRRGFDMSGFLNVFVIEDGVEEAFSFPVELLELMSGLMGEVWR